MNLIRTLAVICLVVLILGMAGVVGLIIVGKGWEE